MRPTPAGIAASEYVLLTTFRKTGVPVATPVWIAPDGEELLVTTGAASGKVKRLRHTPRVTLVPCDVRGRVAEGAVPVEATAVVDGGTTARERVHRALAAKYGVKYRLIRLGGKLRRTSDDASVVVRIRPEQEAGTAA